MIDDNAQNSLISISGRLLENAHDVTLMIKAIGILTKSCQMLQK